MFNSFFANGEPTGCEALLDNPLNLVLIIIMGVLLLFGFIVMPIMRRKQRGSVSELHSNLTVGDKVITVCGIVGTVAHIETNTQGEKEITIETGSACYKSAITVHVTGIYKNLTKPPVPTDFFGRPKAQPSQTHNPSEDTVLTTPNHDLELPLGAEQSVAARVATPAVEPAVESVTAKATPVAAVMEEEVATSLTETESTTDEVVEEEKPAAVRKASTTTRKPTSTTTRKATSTTTRKPAAKKTTPKE